MFRLFLFLSLFLFSCQSSPVKFLPGASSDSLLNTVRNRIKSYADQLDFVPAFHYLDSIGSHIIQSGDDNLISGWLNLKGTTFMHNKQFDSALYYIRQAHTAAQRVNSSNKHLIEAKTSLMNILATQQRYDSAVIYGLEAYQLARKTEDAEIPKVCAALVETYFKMGDTANRRKYLFEAYHYATNPEDKMVLANNLAIYYFDKGAMDSGKLLYKKVMTDSVIQNNLRYKCGTTANMGTLLSSMGQFDEGISYLKEALRICKSKDTPTEKIYMNIANCYAFLNDYNQSNLYYDSARVIAKSKNNYAMVSDAFAFLAENKLAQKRLSESLYNKDSSYFYHIKSDSISFIEKAQELETRYAVKAKDEEIANLAFQNSVNQKIRNQQKIIIFTMIVTLLSLGTIGILFWKRRQIKTRLNESELQQKLLRSQMEPHFLYNALTTMQGFMRDNDNNKAIQYNLQLAKLLRSRFANASKSFVPIKDEVNFIKDYLSLQTLPSENKFDYNLEVYPSYEDDNILIPPMIIQPFLENSIMHGFANINYKGMLIIKVARVGGGVQCLVDDNGSGLYDASQPDQQKHSTAVIGQRLELLSKKTGQPAKLSITDKEKTGEGHGVRVSLQIPFLEDI